MLSMRTTNSIQILPTFYMSGKHFLINFLTKNNKQTILINKLKSNEGDILDTFTFAMLAIDKFDNNTKLFNCLLFLKYKKRKIIRNRSYFSYLGDNVVFEIPKRPKVIVNSLTSNYQVINLLTS